MVSVVSQDVAFAPKLEDLMLVNGQMLTLHEHLQARRKAKPTDAGVCYHTVEDKPMPGQPDGMELVITNELYFRGGNAPAAENKGDGPNRAVIAEHLGSVVTSSVLNSGALRIVWSAKWIPKKGLQPVRPVVATMSPVEIPPLSFVKVSLGRIE